MKTNTLKIPTFRLICAFFLCVLLSHFFFAYITAPAIVDGESMEPALQDGDWILMEKISQVYKTPKRYDMVIVKKDSEDHEIIKRIIGLPGETVQIIGGNVYIDGEKLQNDVYGNGGIMQGGLANSPIMLQEDEYFVLGDNRNNSHDSRYEDIGMISSEEMIGHAVFRFYPNPSRL